MQGDRYPENDVDLLGLRWGATFADCSIDFSDVLFIDYIDQIACIVS